MTLPYPIDTTVAFKRFLRPGVWLEALIAAGILYSLGVSHDSFTAVGLGFVGLVLAGIGYVMLNVIECSVGTLDRDKVVVRPADIGFGLRCAGPSGTFALSQFTAVRCQATVRSPQVQRARASGPAAQLYLVGKSGVPDIMFARTNDDGIVTGQGFAALLGLPFEDSRRTWTIQLSRARETVR